MQKSIVNSNKPGLINVKYVIGTSIIKQEELFGNFFYKIMRKRK